MATRDRTVLWRILLGAAALMFSALSARAEPEITLRLHHFLGPKSPSQTEMIEPWCKRIEAASKGRIKIDVYPSMSLGGKPPELVRQARDGVVDLIWTVNGYTPGLFPRTEVFELPFMHTNDPAATNLAMGEMYEKYLADDYKGLKPLFLHVHAGHAIQMVDTPVHRPEDLAGKKIRIPSRTGAWMLEALGANPVGMPVPELPQALSKHVVDGALIPWEIIPALKLQDMIRYDIEGADKTRFGTITFQLSMNPDRWKALPDDLKKVFLDNSGPVWLKELGEIWRTDDDAGIAIAQKAGATYIELTKEQTDAFRQKLEPVVQRWEKDVARQGIDGAKLVEAARAAIAKYSKKN